MALAVILVVLLFLLFSLLFVPIVFNIDTSTNEYYVRLKGLVKASIEEHETEIFRIRIYAFFTNFYIYPLKKKKPKNKKKPKKHRVSKMKKYLKPKKIVGLLRTFKVKRLFIDIDTGDYILNAKLFPAFAFLNYKIGGTHINFEGRNKVAVRIQNRPIYIISKLLTF